MGALNLQCVVANGTRLLGMSYTNHINDPINANYNTIVLIQSNPTPSSIEDISWTLVSSWPREIYYPQDLSPMVCFVDETTGVFSMMSHFSLTDSTVNTTGIPPRQPGGFQYDPRTDIWSNFTLSAGYNWGDYSSTYTLFRWPGQSALYQANVGSSNSVNIGMLSATNNGSQFVNVNSWTLDPDLYGYPNRLVYGSNNVLYQFGTKVDNNRTGTLKYTLTRIPIFGDPTIFEPLSSNLTVYGAPAMTNCSSYVISSYYKDTLYVFCQGVDDALGPGIGMAMEFKDGATIDTGLNNAYDTFIYRLSGASVQPIDGKQERFAFVVNTPDEYTMQSILLGDADIGQTDGVEYNINITAPFGTPIPNSNNHTGAIIGGTMGGVVLLLIIVIYLLARRRWPTWRKKLRAKVFQMMGSEEDDHDDKIGLHGDDQHPTSKIEEPSLHGDAGICGKILVTEDMELDDIMDVNRGYMQNVEFERHPRPAYWTTLHDGGTPTHTSGGEEQGDGDNTLEGTNRMMALTALRSNSESTIPMVDLNSYQVEHLIPPPPAATRTSRTFAPSAPQLHYTHTNESGTPITISSSQSSPNMQIHQPGSIPPRLKAQEAEQEKINPRFSSSFMDAAPPYSQCPDISQLNTPSFPIPPTPSAPREIPENVVRPTRVNSPHAIIDDNTMSDCHDVTSVSNSSGEEQEEPERNNIRNTNPEHMP